MKKKTIGIVTATRAEYGLLKPLIDSFQYYQDIEIRLLVTGMHLSNNFGNTVNEIEADGILIDEKIDILLDSDTPGAISKSMGLAQIEFANYFSRNCLDMLILLGDRYEILAICATALNFKIPIAHLCGGEITEGAIDDAIRHAITKMSYLHFTISEEYRKRVIQLGESPDRVYNVGSLGNENILKVSLLSKEQLSKSIGFNLCMPYAVVTFHPVTLDEQSAEEQFQQVLLALEECDDMQFIITKANADVGGKVINRMIDEYDLKHQNVYVCESLGMRRYLSAVKHCIMVIGNSSSGIVEVPAFKIPTINIGNRQKGRIEAESVITCATDRREISYAIKRAKSEEFINKLVNMKNPYFKEKTSENIAKIIYCVLSKEKINIQKKFFDINFDY